jgi:hypothetical protein
MAAEFACTGTLQKNRRLPLGSTITRCEAWLCEIMRLHRNLRTCRQHQPLKGRNFEPCNYQSDAPLLVGRERSRLLRIP